MINTPLKISTLYAFAGGLWVLISGWGLQLLVSDPAVITRLTMVKGWAFIAVTASILYWLIARDHAEVRRSIESVSEREELLRNVLETLPVGVWLIDREGKITHGNPAGQRIWGGARFVGIEQFGEYKGWWPATGKLIEAEEWGAVQAIREGKATLEEEIEVEGFDGIRRIILHSAVPLRNKQNEIIGVIVVNEDISSRKLMEERLRDQERIYRELFEHNPQPMWVYAVETMEFLAVNEAAVAHYGYSNQEFLRMTLRDIRSPEEVPALTASVSNNRISFEAVGVWHHRKKDTSIIDVEITTHEVLFNGRAARLVLLNDITERRRLARENAAYQEQLRFMATEMSLIEQRERRQLAITLHDQIGQVLALTKIKLGALQSAGNAAECHHSANEIRQLLDQAINSSRTLTFELSPPILYDLGFEEAVQALCENILQSHGPRLDFSTDKEPKPLADDVRIILFQAIRELLVNIVKHARAASVRVSCRSSNNRIVIEVTDDGSGFQPALKSTRTPASRGFGLFSIRERLHHVGGKMTVESAPGHGTSVTLVAPLQETVKEGALP